MNIMMPNQDMTPTQRVESGECNIPPERSEIIRLTGELRDAKRALITALDSNEATKALKEKCEELAAELERAKRNDDLIIELTCKGVGDWATATRFPSVSLMQVVGVLKERDDAKAELERVQKDNHAHCSALMTTQMWIGLEEERDDFKAELERVQSDMKEAAGELLLPIPEPGTPMAKLLHANVIMRHQRDQLRAELERVQAELGMLRGVDCEAIQETEDGPQPDGPCGVCVKCLKRQRDDLRRQLLDATGKAEL